MKRFSREIVGAWVWNRMLVIEKSYGFDPDNGYAQLTGRSDADIRAYGQYDELRTMIDAFDLRPGSQEGR